MSVLASTAFLLAELHCRIICVNVPIHIASQCEKYLFTLSYMYLDINALAVTISLTSSQEKSSYYGLRAITYMYLYSVCTKYIHVR